MGYRDVKPQKLSDYEETQQALALSEGRLRDALAAINEAFVLYGPDGRLITCNQRFRDLYGYSEEEARPGVHFRELGRIDVARGNVVTGDEQGDGEAYLARKAEYRRRLEGSFIVQLKDGRWLNTTDRRTSEGGFVSIQSDITELKRAEEEMAAAKRQAEVASQAKSEFLANMSHELRTPLNSILGFSELIAQPGFAATDPEKTRDYAEMIHRAGGLLLELINDVLDLSKIEAGQVQLQDAEIDLSEAVETCLSMVRPRAARAEVRLRYEAPARLPRLRADRRYLQQIVLNLLSNAVKFTGEGGEVAVSAELAVCGGLRVVIADDGIGIPVQEQENVMQPFGQVAESYRRGHQGTGLGLPICKSLVELHGGRFDLDSAPGKGTTVRITFPPERTLAVQGGAQSRNAG